MAKDNAILYNQVYDGIDVQYTVLDTSIKEDIVLQKPIYKESYEYELFMSGLTAELKDNQVYLYPEGKSIEEAVYILEAPSMMDAAEAVSFHILLELQKEERQSSQYDWIRNGLPARSASIQCELSRWEIWDLFPTTAEVM